VLGVMEKKNYNEEDDDDFEQNLSFPLECFVIIIEWDQFNLN
jgi:hypothetical protein